MQANQCTPKFSPDRGLSYEQARDALLVAAGLYASYASRAQYEILMSYGGQSANWQAQCAELLRGMVSAAEQYQYATERRVAELNKG